MTVRYVESSRLPTQWGDFDMHGFEDPESNKEHLVLTMGMWATASRCWAGALGMPHWRRPVQPALRLRQPAAGGAEGDRHTGQGALFYLRQEGRGIGLLNKIKAYKLQDAGADTVEANEQLGFGADMRDYSMLGPMFRHLRITAARLMTNNPARSRALEEAGIEVVERIALHTDRNPHNEKYLITKAGKLGHFFDGHPL